MALEVKTPTMSDDSKKDIKVRDIVVQWLLRNKI